MRKEDTWDRVHGVRVDRWESVAPSCPLTVYFIRTNVWEDVTASPQVVGKAGNNTPQGFEPGNIQKVLSIRKSRRTLTLSSGKQEDTTF